MVMMAETETMHPVQRPALTETDGVTDACAELSGQCPLSGRTVVYPEHADTQHCVFTRKIRSLETKGQGKQPHFSLKKWFPRNP